MLERDFLKAIIMVQLYLHNTMGIPSGASARGLQSLEERGALIFITKVSGITPMERGQLMQGVGNVLIIPKITTYQPTTTMAVLILK